MTFAKVRKRVGFSLIIGAAAVVLLSLVWYQGRSPRNGYSPPDRSFDGDSKDLTETVIVPTLDTPIPGGKSAIWCSAFQLAWNKLKTEIAKGPIDVENAKVVAERLNRAEASDADIASNSFYAAAGLARDGIADKIRGDMAEKFPSAASPQFSSDLLVIAYAYLQAGISYRYAYFEGPSDFVFKDSAGTKTPIRTFGIQWSQIGKGLDTFRDQVEVLFAPADSEDENGDFGLDLSRFSEPNQLVLAALKRRPTLAQALAEVQQKSREYKPEYPDERHLGPADQLLVPDMHWRVDHHFRELEGRDKKLLNSNLARLHLAVAQEQIDFLMDRNGAGVAAEAKVGPASQARIFRFNRPFLIRLSKRGAKQPFFVMWVDNAELMQRR
jgi:hypothetical protein